MTWLRHSMIAALIAVSVLLSAPEAMQASADACMVTGSVGALYIDPGTGSIIIQALIGVLVGGIAMIGIYRVRVKNFLVNLFTRRKGDEESE